MSNSHFVCLTGEPSFWKRKLAWLVKLVSLSHLFIVFTVSCTIQRKLDIFLKLTHGMIVKLKQIIFVLLSDPKSYICDLQVQICVFTVSYTIFTVNSLINKAAKFYKNIDNKSINKAVGIHVWSFMYNYTGYLLILTQVIFKILVKCLYH